MTRNWRWIFCSNVTGVDWLDREIAEKVKVTSRFETVDGVETEVEETFERRGST